MLRVVARRLQSAPWVIMFLDYDGTLVPFAPTPDQALPDAEVLALVTRLGRRRGFAVHIVSGRPRDTIERWLGTLPVSLHAEHGAWSRPAGTAAWTSPELPAARWRTAALGVLREFAARTPGALIEEKTFGLAWHYRMADPGHGPAQAAELRRRLRALFADEPVEVLLGEKVVELRPPALHKGRVVVPAVERAGPGAICVAIGDDRTDEDLFAALPPGSVAIHVGPAKSRAPLRLPDPTAVRRFLRSLLDGAA